MGTVMDLWATCDSGADGEEEDGATFAVCTKTKYHLRRRRKRRADEKVPVFRLLC